MSFDEAAVLKQPSPAVPAVTAEMSDMAAQGHGGGDGPSGPSAGLPPDGAFTSLPVYQSMGSLRTGW